MRDCWYGGCEIVCRKAGTEECPLKKKAKP